jgi:hypothetical protein
MSMRFAFGICLGLWFGAWLSMASPLIPFFLAYPFGIWALWRASGEERGQ